MGYGLQLQKSFFPLINEPPINCQMILIKAKELFNYIKIKLNWMLSNHSTALFEWFTQHGLFCCHNILNSAYNYISVSCQPARKRYWRELSTRAQTILAGCWRFSRSHRKLLKYLKPFCPRLQHCEVLSRYTYTRLY